MLESAGGVKFVQFAKTAKWDQDLYESLVQPYYRAGSYHFLMRLLRVQSSDDVGNLVGRHRRCAFLLLRVERDLMAAGAVLLHSALRVRLPEDHEPVAGWYCLERHTGPLQVGARR